MLNNVLLLERRYASSGSGARPRTESQGVEVTPSKGLKLVSRQVREESLNIFPFKELRSRFSFLKIFVNAFLWSKGCL